ncbi:hypothetical protein HCZ23_16635 [Celeribacter sp. HF31]|uniref:hypothetical protein n=1 Tax=Celeribacter sp. HF31 TaxID=2721558 RepID=UPI001430336A|nr:hypothetical protein [Celeribacter sp. HF31]NIY81091.1 hypothetical protein [Celeribacter sp. HF31]
MTETNPFPLDFPAVDLAIDPEGMILAAYRNEAMGIDEARTIYLDWAFRLGPRVSTSTAIRRLLALYAPQVGPGHPMTHVLREGLKRTQQAVPRAWEG